MTREDRVVTLSYRTPRAFLRSRQRAKGRDQGAEIAGERREGAEKRSRSRFVGFVGFVAASSSLVAATRGREAYREERGARGGANRREDPENRRATRSWIAARSSENQLKLAAARGRGTLAHNATSSRYSHLRPRAPNSALIPVTAAPDRPNSAITS